MRASPDRANFRSGKLTFCFSDPREFSPQGRLAYTQPALWMPARRLLLQSYVQEALERPFLAVGGRAHVVDHPAAVLADEVVAHDVVRRRVLHPGPFVEELGRRRRTRRVLPFDLHLD